MPLSY